MSTLTIHPVESLRGEIRPPSDKSLTHRSYMLAAIAQGKSVVRNPLRGEDCEATLDCLIQMGLGANWISREEVSLTPAEEWSQPIHDLDCGNSGTTMRLLSGLIASRPLDVKLTGDASLSRRPMKRVAEPLRLMGATVEGDTPPLHIMGTQLKGIDYRTPVPSAQIKSCVLLAGLRAEGETAVTETELSRDHTERMLRACGVRVDTSMTEHGWRAALQGGQVLSPLQMSVPGDISSAAFMMIAAALVPGSEAFLRQVGVNPSRTGILDVLDECGVRYERQNEVEETGEPSCDLVVWNTPDLSPFKVAGPLVPRLIDEIPVLAVLATQCHGVSQIRDAAELRVKESDRIERVASGLRQMGAQVETFDDGMAISGPCRLSGACIDAEGDHRLAMAFAVAGLISNGPVVIDGAEAIQTSYPAFESDLMRLAPT
ncbi:MAG: 3-phosphoshikimate 1-carboxyvinyltransferase [Fimbriimonadaceae bacterium]|nr:3-phosphoshikimate 1-carboxyvinyltransferase [Fimbriimonadaceae bacterium]